MTGQEIKAYLEENGIIQSDFAENIGVRQTNVSRWITKNIKLSNKSAKKVLSYYPDFHQSGETTTTPIRTKTTHLAQTNSSEPGQAVERYLSVVEAANIDEFMGKTHTLGKIDISEFIDAQDAMMMTGDALAGKINGGDIMAQKEWHPRNYFDYGRVYAVFTRDHVFVRYLKKHSDPDKVLLKAKNQHYDDVDLPISEIKRLFVVNGALVQY